MTVAPRTIFHLEHHTWVAVLVVAVGFGVVGSLALLAGGETCQGLLCLPIPVIFAYTARTLHRPGGLFRASLARALDIGLLALAAMLAVTAALPLAQNGLRHTHPLVLTGATMAILIQVAVAIVAVESANRLAPGEPQHPTGGPTR